MTADLEHDFLVLRLLLDVSREVLEKLWRLTLAYDLDYRRWNPASRINYNSNTACSKITSIILNHYFDKNEDIT